ncbi:MAG: hypothetical protein KA536_11580 [Saprospiraceae bacterium]|nr:hypothetical protein [Saprospiraceae bacterium]
MNFKVIDTYDTTLKYLETHYHSLGTFSLITETKIVDILAQIDSDTGGVFIKIENSYAGSNKSELKGIELIFWLRLKLNFLGPIITYGFLSTDQILKLNPKHLIIHAPGNFHWRLGDKLDDRDITGHLRTDFIKSEAFKPYLKAAFDLNEFRHEEANWWAMKSLIDVHRAYEECSYPIEVENKLKHVNNLIACFIHNIDALDKDHTAFNHKTENRDEVKDKKNILIIDDLINFGWKETYTTVLQKEFTLDFLEISLAQNIDDLYSNFLEFIGQYREYPYAILLDLRLLKIDISSEPYMYSGLRLLKKIKTHYPQIPIIITSASIKTLPFTLSREYGAEAFWLKIGLDSHPTKDEIIDNYYELKYLLKILNYDEYRIKKQVEFFIYKLNNHEKFWWHNHTWDEIDVTTEKKNNHTFEESKLNIEGQVKTVFSNMLIFLNEYLHEKYISKNEYNFTKEGYYHTMIMLKIGEIIEAIHPAWFFKKEKDTITSGLLAGHRGDATGKNIYYRRSEYAHHKPKKKDLNFFIESIEIALRYLSDKIIVLEDTVKKQAEESMQKRSESIAKNIIDDTNKKIDQEFKVFRPDRPKLEEIARLIPEITEKLEKADLYFKRKN